MSHALIPLSYWEQSLTTSIHVINTLSLVGLTKLQSLYHVLYHKLHIYYTVRVFGCSCFPFTRPYNTYKLEFRNQECVFLGTSSQHHGYKCLSKTGKIIIYKDVTYHEQVFSFPKKFPSNSSISFPHAIDPTSLHFPRLQVSKGASPSSNGQGNHVTHVSMHTHASNPSHPMSPIKHQSHLSSQHNNHSVRLVHQSISKICLIVLSTLVTCLIPCLQLFQTPSSNSLV